MIIRKVKPLIPYFAHMRIVEDDGPFLESGPRKKFTCVFKKGSYFNLYQFLFKFGARIKIVPHGGPIGQKELVI